jgi:hypothetical protein
MGSPYLSTDESIILSTHDLIINTVPAEAILTNQRLMLVDKTHPRHLPQDIPFAAIETVTIGENTASDPIISLSIATPDGTRQPLGIIFPQGPRARRMTERDEWATRIRELSVIAQHDTGVEAFELIPPWVPGPVPEDTADEEGAEVVPAGTRFKSPSLSERRNRAAGSSKTRALAITAAVLIIILVAVLGVFYAPSFIGQPAPPVTPIPTPVETTAPVIVPTPTEVPTPEPTVAVTEVAVTQVQSGIPKTGVWVRVRYDGTFTGSVGAPGRFRSVSGTGDQFYQIPAKDELVSATIQKGDNSGNPLTVDFYYNGVMVQTETITKPKGVLDLDVDLKRVAAPAGTTAVVTASP